MCGRLAPNQLIHVCAGKPVPFSKVPGQVLPAVDYEQATFEQGDLEAVLATDGGRAALDPERGLRQPPSNSTICSETRPSKTLPKSKTEGRRWRYLAQRSRDDPKVDTGPDPWEPIDCEEINEGFEKEPILVIQNEVVIATIPLRNTETISKDSRCTTSGRRRRS